MCHSVKLKLTITMTAGCYPSPPSSPNRSGSNSVSGDTIDDNNGKEKGILAIARSNAGVIL